MNDEAAFRGGGGELGELVRTFDWAATSLGPIDTWPQSLRTAVGTLLLSPTPIVLLWGEEGVMIYNDAYSGFAGGRHPRLLGSKVREGWPEVAAFDDHVMRVGLAGGTLSYKNQELVLTRFAGRPERAWMNLDYSPVLDESGQPAGVIAIVVETTERVLAEQHLQRSEALVRENAQRVQLALAAGAIIGTWFWDLPTDRFTVDEGFARSFGLDPALGHSGLSLEQVVATVHPDDKPGLANAIEDAIARGGAYAHQYRVRRADGRYYWIEANGRVDHAPDGTPLSFPGVLIDVEERRAVQAERDRALAALRTLNETLEQRVEERTRELRDAQDFTRLALTSIGGVGAWTYDAASNRFFCSQAIAELYGIDPDQAKRGIAPAAFTANVHPDDKAALAATMAGGLERAGDLELEYRICHPDGAIRWVLSRGYTYHENGMPIRRVGIGVETTKQHQLEEQLRQSQKMEAVGQLTGGLAHDFNNLLTGITGSLELLGMRVAQGRTQDLERYIGAAQGAAGRAAALTHRLLAFSRRQTLDPKPTDVNRLVEGLEELLRRTVGPAVELEVSGAAGLWPILVDPNQLENAVLNLCINARDAMPAGGRIGIETANRWLDQRAAQERDLAPGQYVSLCVSDTGTGMAPEVVAKAFDPFFTTKPLGQGTGLGLSMIYGFVRQSGGQVRIDSEPGQGTVVCLYLPRHLGTTDTAETVADPGEALRAGKGETVLVVDDEPTVRMLVTEVLEELGYTAIEAIDGASGLRVLQSEARWICWSPMWGCPAASTVGRWRTRRGWAAQG